MKLLKLLTTFSLFTIILAGCSPNIDTVVDLEAVSSNIQSNIEFSDELMELKFPTLKDFYDIEESDLKYYEVYISSSGSTSEEIAVFEAKDQISADKIKSCANERIDDLKFSFENYRPEEIDKLNNAVLVTRGNYIMMCISDHPDEVKKIFQNE